MVMRDLTGTTLLTDDITNDAFQARVLFIKVFKFAGKPSLRPLHRLFNCFTGGNNS